MQWSVEQFLVRYPWLRWQAGEAERSGTIDRELYDADGLPR
jgi:hypothetical protein